jgi:hypothetical protein
MDKTANPLKDSRLSDGINLELTLPSDGAFKPTIVVRATFPDKEPIKGNPESLACYEKHAYITLGSLATLGRMMLTLHAGPLTGATPVPAEKMKDYEQALAKITAEAAATAMLDVALATAKEPETRVVIETLRATGAPSLAILRTLGPLLANL